MAKKPKPSTTPHFSGAASATPGRSDQDAAPAAGAALEAAHAKVMTLVSNFRANQRYYFSDKYLEMDVRTDFINHLFHALGWIRSNDPYRQEMKLEQSSHATKGRADYAFSLAPSYHRVRFYVEAKRPQPSIDTPDNCFQAIRYSWPKGIPITALTDFCHIHVVDCRFRPNIDTAAKRIVRTWHYTELENRDRFCELYWLLSREAVSNGSIENFARNELPPEQVAAKQYSLFPGEAREFDDDFLQKLDGWRERLARSFKRADTSLTGAQLTECVQRTLDRLVFVSFLEDKGIEPEQIVSRFGQAARSHWRDFVLACSRLDAIYNGIVFKRHSVIDAGTFEPSGRAFEEICEELTDEHSAYNFDSVPVEILGRIYERFLGKVVLTQRNTVEVIEKEDVRRAGGVYYTPDYIVRYMIDNSLTPQIRGKKPSDILKMRIMDTSCGSGSFLIGAFDALMRAALDYYKQHPKDAKKDVLETRNGEVHLSLSCKREFLLNCMYGVDIDRQAVEVAQLSLYLKLMEDETTLSAKKQQTEMGIALLPSLSANIVVGNSLVDDEQNLFGQEMLRDAKSLDFKKTFRAVFRSGGFDLVIGNPPYIKEYTNREAFDFVRRSPYYMGKMDIWYMFACRGLDWLKAETGMLAFIATNNWVTNYGAKKLREKIAADARIEQLIDFGEFRVFRDAGIQTMILIARKRLPEERYTFDYRRLGGRKPTLLEARALLDRMPGPNCHYLTPTTRADNSRGAPLTLSASRAEALLDKIAARQNFELDGAKEIAQGIVAPQDRLNAAGRAKLGDGFVVGQGIFTLTAEERAALKLSKAEGAMLKPFYTTAELRRYAADPSNKQWVIYTDSGFGDAAEIARYPRLKKHLDRFAKIITSSHGPYGLHRARDERFFVGEKIMSLRKCAVPCFTYTDFPCYVSQTFNVIKTSRVNLVFLTGLLNSRLARFWLAHKGKMQGHLYQVDKEPLLAIPLCIPAKPEQERLAKMVRRVMRSLEFTASAPTDSDKERWQRRAEQDEEDLQEEIEVLYGLTDEEKALVAGYCSGPQQSVAGTEDAEKAELISN